MLLNRPIHQEGINILEAGAELLGPLANDQILSLKDQSGIQALIASPTLDLSGDTMDLLADPLVLARHRSRQRRLAQLLNPQVWGQRC